jgi:cellulose synthase/poly-beta-1,6-N-acetylglucosamine synthase-like glycosyltransferase
MTSQGEGTRWRLAAAMATSDREYNASSGEAPIELLAPLFALIFAFGVFLTAFVPYGYVTRAAAELGRGEILPSLWCVALAGLSLFVLLRWCTIQTMAFIVHCKLKADRADPPATWPLVSILVPAYQESTTIASALRALVDLDYPNYEIIVVDDGSSDDTFEQASAFVGCHDRCSLNLFRKANGGKWSALNLAFEHATADLVLCIDADSRISRDALKRLIMRLDRPEVAGVSGQITVRNRRRMITRLQAYEYVVANGGLRTAQSLFGLVLVVPGPIGLYRRRALQDVFEKDTRVAHRPPSGAGTVPGPFSPETFAEDFQLSLTILALGGRIVYEPGAVSYTKSPDLTHTLLSQRYRWYRGTLQVLRIYLRRLRHVPGSRKRRLNLVIAAVYLLDLFVLPVLNVVILFGVAIIAATSATPADLLLWVVAIWLLNLLSATYHVLSQRDHLSLLSLVPFYDLYHGLLLNCAWAIAMFDELRQSKMNW